MLSFDTTAMVAVLPCVQPRARAKARAKAKTKTKARAKAKTRAKAQPTGKATATTKAVVYLRTSSAANTGDDKDSEPRQRGRCQAYADRRGMWILAEFRDPAVSGTDPLICRRGFAAMVQYCKENAADTILVESGDRFARNLMVQETGLGALAEFGIRVICADNDAQFTNPGSTGALVRQMLGAVSEFVAAQSRKRLSHGRNKALAVVAADPAGRRSYRNAPKLGGPVAILERDAALVRQMRAYARMQKHQRPSLKVISQQLKAKNTRWSVRAGPNKGKPWSSKQVRTFLLRFQE